MGNARKPRALKVIAGTTKPSRDYAEVQLEAIGVAGLAEPPAWLPESGRVEYFRAGAILASANVLTAADETTLLAYAAIWASLVRLWANEMRPTAADLSAFRLLANDLGLTPRARASLPPSSPGSESNRFARNGKRTTHGDGQH